MEAAAGADAVGASLATPAFADAGGGKRAVLSAGM